MVGVWFISADSWCSMLPLKSTALLAVAMGYLWRAFFAEMVYLVLLNRKAGRDTVLERVEWIQMHCFSPLRLSFCCGLVSLVFQLHKPLFHHTKEQCRLWSNPSRWFCDSCTWSCLGGVKLRQLWRLCLVCLILYNPCSIAWSILALGGGVGSGRFMWKILKCNENLLWLEPRVSAALAKMCNLAYCKCQLHATASYA